MSVVNTETGELLALDSAAAERRAERIRMRLDDIADNYAAVMPMIREAIEKRDDLALGYRSVSEYVSDRFGGALTRLGMEVRREVVRELTEAGMSTRSIAPVVGVSNKTVHQDQRAAVTSVTPMTSAPVAESQAASAEPQARPAQDAAGPHHGPSLPSAAVMLGNAGPNTEHKVTGIDGKTYSRPEPKAPKAPPRRALTDQFFDAAYDLTKTVERVVRLAEDDRWPQNAEKVAAKHRNDLLQAIDGLQSVVNQLPA